MRLLILPLLCLTTIGCIHRYRNSDSLAAAYTNSSGHDDTLICIFQSCTECLDLCIVKGRLGVPKEFKTSCCNDSTSDIKVCGNFPLDLIDMTSDEFNPNAAYEITGKVVSLDINNGMGKVPLFYVHTLQRKSKNEVMAK